MPVDEHDERAGARGPETGEGGAPLKFTEAAGGDAPSPLTPRGQRARWRRVVNRRNAMWTGIAAAAALIVLVVVTVRVRDLYAFSLKRNVDLESLELDGLELWVTFDEHGRSNFANLRLPEPDPNRR